MTYNPGAGNPFAVDDPNKEWKRNELILKDPQLRAKAGVTVLDAEVSELFGGAEAGVELSGGAAIGTPFFIDKFGSKQAKNLQLGLGAHQSGGMPYHYYANNRRW